MDNAELLRQLAAVRAGDRAAFEAVYHAWKAPLFTVALRVTRDRATAEDVLQGVFLKLYQSPPEPSVNPRAYLFQMARNLAVDSVRRERRMADFVTDEPDCAAADDLPQRLDLEAALDRLPEAERDIVSLHLTGGLTFREIAGVLALPLGTVLWKYQRALGRLRLFLSEV